MSNRNALCLACGLSVLVLGGYGKNATSTVSGNPAAEPPASKSTQAAGLAYAVKEFAWKVGDSSVPLIRTDAGVCFLCSLSGHFAGFGEEVGVHPAGDGFWHLQGKGQQEGVAAKATSISSLTPALFRPGVQEYQWANGQASVRMLHKNEGVCFLSGLSGSFAGYGEEVRVRLAEDGYWYLGGQSGQEALSARAIAVRVGMNRGR